MTGRDHGDDRDYPDGSVGRYVREKWGTTSPPEPGRAPRPSPEVGARSGDEDTDTWAYQPAPTSAGNGATEGRANGLPARGTPSRQNTTNGVRPGHTVGAPEPDDAGPGTGFDLAVGNGLPGAPTRSAGAASDTADTSGVWSSAASASGSDPDSVDSAAGWSSPGRTDGSTAGRAAGAPRAGDPASTGSSTPHLSAPRGWATDKPLDAEPDGPVADPRTTNAPVPPHRLGAYDLATPPSGVSPTAAAPVPTGRSAEAQAQAAPPPFGGRRHEPPRRPASLPPRTAGRDTGHWTDPTAVAAQEAQQARQPELSSARLLRPAKRPPQSGWRRMIYVLSGRMFNPGESPTDIRRRELTMRVNQPLLGCYKIAMLSLKGGVGKTTMTATLGATFASLRGDRVVAVDANPDRGTLSQKIPLETSATVRNLLRDAQRVRRYTDVRAYTSQGPSRLEVLASEQDPAVSEAFSERDYRRTVDLLEHFYNIVLTDCGTGLMHSAMYGVLGVADQLVIVSSGSIDGARSASATMDWLDAHGHGELVANSVVVINFVHRSRGGVDLNRVSEHFAARCRAVVRIPFDAHLEEGAEIDLDRLEPNTRMALLELAANVADAFESVHSL
jgi:MinD-like ATPase involved in chromosome partitioning or flagellar assembly